MGGCTYAEPLHPWVNRYTGTPTRTHTPTPTLAESQKRSTYPPTLSHNGTCVWRTAAVRGRSAMSPMGSLYVAPPPSCGSACGGSGAALLSAHDTGHCMHPVTTYRTRARTHMAQTWHQRFTHSCKNAWATTHIITAPHSYQPCATCRYTVARWCAHTMCMHHRCVQISHSVCTHQGGAASAALPSPTRRCAFHADDCACPMGCVKQHRVCKTARRT